MNSENNNNPDNVNKTEDSLFSDIPELISDSEFESDAESDTISETDYSDIPELISIHEDEDENVYESDTLSETDYSDMPDLISSYQLQLINNLCKRIQNNNNFFSEPETDSDSDYNELNNPTNNSEVHDIHDYDYDSMDDVD